VLTEETAIIVGALVALGLVVLGTLELLWPLRGTPDAESGEPRRRWRSSHPRHAARTRERYLKPAKPTETTPIRRPQSTQPGAAVAPAVTPTLTTAAPVTLITSAPVGREPVNLAPATPAPAAPMGLAQQALSDHAAARAALETAIATAPDAARATYQRQLATLALAVARDLLAAAGAAAAPDSEGRVSSLRDALAWLERGCAAAPDDPELRELMATAEARLWPAYEQLVLALLQRQEFRAARGLLREALERPGVPPARADTFRELFSGTFSGEIGQLTAQAIRSMQEARESEALGALERAERLLESVHDEALPPKRREEVDHRLWWGYNKLGRRRVDAGAFEEAIEPLVRALRLAATAPDRQAETRGALVRAFEGWIEAAALAIGEVADAGDREAALVRSDKLWTRLRAALQEGLSEQDLGVAFARVQRLFEEIGRPRA
jgi:tetratricopeptide (TPR) repeat protein